MSEAGTAQPPSRGGLTAYARSPRRRIRFVTVAMRINGNNEPVDSFIASAKLSRSNDGQVHTVSQYARLASFVLRVVKRSRGSAQSSARPAFHTSRPTPPASTAPHTAVRDDSRSAPFIG